MHVEATPGDKSVDDLCRRFPELTRRAHGQDDPLQDGHRRRRGRRRGADARRPGRQRGEAQEPPRRRRSSSWPTRRACAASRAASRATRARSRSTTRSCASSPTRASRRLTGFLCGVNRKDVHALDVRHGRDFPTPPFADLRRAREGDRSPRSGRRAQDRPRHRGRPRLQAGHEVQRRDGRLLPRPRAEEAARSSWAATASASRASRRRRSSRTTTRRASSGRPPSRRTRPWSSSRAATTRWPPTAADEDPRRARGAGHRHGARRPRGRERGRQVQGRRARRLSRSR